MQLNENHGKYHFQYGSDWAIGHFLTIYDDTTPTDYDDNIILEVDSLTQRGSTPELTALAKEMRGMSYNAMLSRAREFLGV